ncbi:MAG: hypothetical protein ABW278_01575 [Steroidobacteraceae bacterium]
MSKLGRILLVIICCVAATGAAAQRVAEPQRRAAEEYLAALAGGDARSLAMTIQEDELVALRRQLMEEMQLQADRSESLTRSRLFGAAMPLADIERLTPQNFFATLALRLRFGGRDFDSVEWLAAVPDSGSMVQLVGRLRPPKAQGNVRVPVLVSLVPWGKDWKAALPLELQAQIDDLRSGRMTAPAAPAAPAAATQPAAAVANANPQAILELLAAATDNLKAGRCEDYYDEQMSPNFRRTTGTKALRTLIAACEKRDTLREQLLAALAAARSGTPRFEYAGTRASYDLREQGLPFAKLVLEQVDKRWFIAE